MSAPVNGPNVGQSGPTQNKPDPAKQAQMRQKFESEKSAALASAQGNQTLIAQINGISPHKGAMQELAALIDQGGQNTQNNKQNKTIGMA